MYPISQILLVSSNLVLAAAVSFYVLKPAPAPSAPVLLAPTPSAPPQAAMNTRPPVIDLQPILKPIEALDQSVTRLSLTLQRFNTTTLQYEYLQAEIERLAQLDQTLGSRINLGRSAPSQTKSAKSENDLKQLAGLQDQIQQEIKRRRGAVTQLIAGLEQQLGAATVGKTTVVAAPSSSSTPANNATPANRVMPAQAPAPANLPVRKAPTQ
jgi:hypothetical protein